jgi:GTPase SAR1 family protein
MKQERPVIPVFFLQKKWHLAILKRKINSASYYSCSIVTSEETFEELLSALEVVWASAGEPFFAI